MRNRTKASYWPPRGFPNNRSFCRRRTGLRVRPRLALQKFRHERIVSRINLLRLIQDYYKGRLEGLTWLEKPSV